MNKFLFLLIGLCNSLIAQERIGFLSEKIDFSITSLSFDVNGIYTFTNDSENEIYQIIIFPFSVSSDSINVKRVYNLTYSKNLIFNKITNGIAFNLNVLSKDTVNVNISYCQKTEKENIYILESTQTWSTPLQKADYSLTFDNSIEIDSLSLRPDFFFDNVYYWNKTDFYPNENFKIWIK